MIEGVHGDARRVELHGADRIRSYESVEDEYAAATEAAAVFDRGGDAVLTIDGKQAEKMLLGFVSGEMPAPPSDGESPGVVTGAGKRQTVLTPKGRMVADLVLLREEDGDGIERYLALVPAAALGGFSEHCGRYLPPRFAKVTDLGDKMARISVTGPGAAALLSRSVLGLRVEASELETLAPWEWLSVNLGGDVLRVIRSDEFDSPSWELLVAEPDAAGVWKRLVESGAVPMGAAAREILRVEAGTPVYGAELDEGTIPTEAGLDRVAIDHTKGCYTGQEVIVRIRDRGHVNRELRRILLGEMPTPASGTELFVQGRDKPAAEVRSAVWSPRYRQAAALAYVRRGVWDDDADQPEFFTG